MLNVLKCLNDLPRSDGNEEGCGPGPEGFWKGEAEQTGRRVTNHFLAFDLSASMFETSVGSFPSWKGSNHGQNFELSFEGQLLRLILNSWRVSGPPAAVGSKAVLFSTFHTVIFPSLSPSSFPFLLFVPLQMFAGWYNSDCSLGLVTLGYSTAVFPISGLEN